MIHAAIALKRSGTRIPGRLIFSAVMGEEEGQIGMRDLLDRGMKADGFVSTQWSTAGRVAISYRGVCWLEVTTTGRSAHGSRPIEGVNAVEEMASLVLPRLKAVRLPIHADDPAAGPFVNLAAVNGGDVANVVPDTCRALLDYRITPGQRTESLLQEIEKAVDELRLRYPVARRRDARAPARRADRNRTRLAARPPSRRRHPAGDREASRAVRQDRHRRREPGARASRDSRRSRMVRETTRATGPDE